MNKNLGILLLLLVTLLWSNGFLATQNAIDASLKVEAILSIRFLLAALLLALVLYYRKEAIPPSTWRHGLVSGCILYIAFYTQTLGQETAAISLVALITSCYVLFVPFLMWIFKKRKPTLRIYLCTFLTLLGLLILNYQGEGIYFSAGALLVLLSALTFAFHVSYTGAFCDAEPALGLTFVQLLVAGLLSLITMLVRQSFPSSLELQNGIFGVLYLAIFSTAICYFLQILGQKYVKAENASIIMAMEGVFAAFLSIALGYESFALHIFVGGSFVILGAILINLEKANPPI